MGRKNKNENDLLLLNMINEKLTGNSGSNTESVAVNNKKPSRNVFQFGEVESEESEVENEVSSLTSNVDSSFEPEPVAKSNIVSKKNKKKNKKAKKKKIVDSDDSISDFSEKDDEDIELLLKDIQLSNKYKLKEDIKENGAIDFELSSLLNDPGYTEIYPIYTKLLKDLFSQNSINYKLLDFETELKLLFDDLSEDILNEAVESSLPYMKNLKRIIKPWGVKKNGKEIVPQGKNMTKELLFSHVMPDFIPTWLPDFQTEKLNTDSHFKENWYLERNEDWKDLINEDYEKLKDSIGKNIYYYKVVATNLESTVKVNSEFYLNIQLTQDVNAFITQCRQPTNYYNILLNYQLIQTLLIQASDIDQNSDRFPEINQILNKCMFVIDRSLKKNFEFNGLYQLPYNYFYNRVYYLVLLQYIRILNSKGLYRTVGEWCKVLLSLSPLDDPMGVKYFAGDCWIKSLDYHWLIKLSESGVISKYKEWKCINIMLPTLLAFIKLGNEIGLKKFLRKHFLVTRDDSNPALKESQYILNWSLKQFLAVATKKNDSIEDDSNISDYYKLCLDLYLQSYDKTWSDAEISKLEEVFNKFEMVEDNFIPKKNIKTITNAHFIQSIPINFIRLNKITSNTKVMSKLNSFIGHQDTKDYPFDPLPTMLNSFEYVEDFTNKKLLSALYEGRLMSIDEFM